MATKCCPARLHRPPRRRGCRRYLKNDKVSTVPPDLVETMYRVLAGSKRSAISPHARRRSVLSSTAASRKAGLHAKRLGEAPPAPGWSRPCPAQARRWSRRRARRRQDGDGGQVLDHASGLSSQPSRLATSGRIVARGCGRCATGGPGVIFVERPPAPFDGLLHARRARRCGPATRQISLPRLSGDAPPAALEGLGEGGHAVGQQLGGDRVMSTPRPPARPCACARARPVDGDGDRA